jgi:hypothetical protein
MKKIFLTLLSLGLIFSLIANISSAECNLFNLTNETNCNSYDGCAYQEANCSVFAYNEAGCLATTTCTYGDNYSCSEFDNQQFPCQVQGSCSWHGDEPIPAYCEGEYPCENWGVGDCELEGCTWHPEEPVPTGWCEGFYIAGDSCNGLYFNGTCAGTFFAGIFASIDYPLNQTYSENITTLNYTITNATSCFYSFNETNYSLACNETAILLDAFYGNNTWTIYADNISDSVTFFVNISLTQFYVDYSNGVLDTLTSAGAGLGKFIIFMASAISILLLGFLVWGMVSEIGGGFVSSLKRFWR